MTSKWSGRSVDSLVGTFLQLGKSYPPIDGEGGVEAFDRHRNEMAAVAKALKESGSEGEAALLSLMDHELVPIRLTAAQASLSFAKDRAIDVLIDIIEARAAEFSMDAMFTLLFAGEYDMNAGPKRRPYKVPLDEQYPRLPSRPKK